jgi:DNA/RNA-binding domain of Phe-tRNA-synthetase-like protein
MVVTVVNEAGELGVFVAYDVVLGVDNTRYTAELEEEISLAVAEVRQTLSLETLKDHPVVRA